MLFMQQNLGLRMQDFKYKVLPNPICIHCLEKCLIRHGGRKFSGFATSEMFTRLLMELGAELAVLPDINLV